MAKPPKRKQSSSKSKRVPRDLAPRAGARVRGGADLAVVENASPQLQVQKATTGIPAVETMVFTSVSNVLKTRHDVTTNSIDNAK